MEVAIEWDVPRPIGNSTRAIQWFCLHGCKPPAKTTRWKLDDCNQTERRLQYTRMVVYFRFRQFVSRKPLQTGVPKHLFDCDMETGKTGTARQSRRISPRRQLWRRIRRYGFLNASVSRKHPPSKLSLKPALQDRNLSYIGSQPHEKVGF